MNPTSIENGIPGREMVDGTFISAFSPALEYDLLIETLSKIHESLIVTTDLLTEEYLLIKNTNNTLRKVA